MKNEPKNRIASFKPISIPTIWIVLLSFLLSFIGCSSSMPVKSFFKDEIRVVTEFDVVWDAVLSFFEKYEFEVTSADKISGIIVAEAKKIPKGWMDCGNTGFLEYRLSSSGVIQVSVDTGFSWGVNIQVVSNFERIAKKFLLDYYVTINCNSTGALEKQLFNEIAQEATSIEVQVQTDDTVGNMSASYGTGFFIAPTGEIVTCYHLIKDKKQIWIKHQVRERLLEAKVIAVDEKSDIAILRPSNLLEFPQGLINDIPYRLKTNYEFVTGSELSLLRYPLVDFEDEEAIYKEGTIVGNVDTNTTSRIFQFSIPIWYGNSGAPVMTDSGYIIGMAVPTSDVKQFAEVFGTIPSNSNFAVKSYYIDSLLSTIPHIVKLSDDPLPLNPDRLSKYIVAIKAK